MRNGVQWKKLSIIGGDAPRRWLPDQGIPLPRSNIAKTYSSSQSPPFHWLNTHVKGCTETSLISNVILKPKRGFGTTQSKTQ